jgi:subtilisin family serine protease
MIDTGIASHPTLAGIRIESRNFGPRTERLTDHGTAVASLLVRGGAGEIVAADVFRGNGKKSYTSADSIAEALGWMVEQHVPVINMSLVGPRNLILDRVVASVIKSGRIIVAAAGNNGPTAPPAYPAAQPDVVAVTAVDSRGRVYRYANRGAYVDVSAVGVGVPAAAPGGRITPHSGTSFAAPHVAVALARCARQVSQSNSACIGAMERRARDLGQPGRDSVYGAGLVE